MRKFLQISFLITYLVFSVGVTTTVKYCGDEITDVGMINPISSNETGCDCCEDVFQSSCCEIELIIVKILDFHESSLFRTIPIIPIDYAPVSEDTQLIIDEENLINSQLDINHAPPDKSVYIINCVFLI